MATEEQKFQLTHCRQAVICGAGRGIGLSLTRALLQSYPALNVFATYRDEARAQELLQLASEENTRLTAVKVDPLEEDQLHHLSEQVSFSGEGKIQLLINVIGYLHRGDEDLPERQLAQVNKDQLTRYFQVNSIVTPLLAKHFYPLFKHSQASCFAALSAKVGSIEDNRLGGWYGYRASKAALNMLIKNISLEFQRRGCRTLVTALHPGTTKTDLSHPFTRKTSLQLHTADETARNLLNVINERSIDESGSFYSWNGEKLAW